VRFLTRPEIEAVLAAPDRTTWLGRRDHTLLLLAAQTGLRLSELTGLDRDAVHIGSGAHVRCVGKGRKERTTPLTTLARRALQAWLEEPVRKGATALFPNMHGGRLSAKSDNVVASDDIFAAGQFERERLVQRRNGGEVEGVETLHRWKVGAANTALDHAPFAIDEFEFGKTQEEADMIETFAGGLRGDFFIFAQESRQFELA
jgi:hypothetical protein